MSKSIKIGNETFSVHRSKYTNPNRLTYYDGRTLADCYTKPSFAKLSIYNEWLKWSVENNINHFGVSSYNTFGFSLQGLATVNGVDYVLSITPSSNKAYIVE